MSTTEQIETLNGFSQITSRTGTTEPGAPMVEHVTISVRAKGWPPSRPPADARVVVTTPYQGVLRGTAVLIAGGQGRELWSANGNTNGAETVDALVERGWRVVELAFPAGWFPIPWDGPVRAHSQAVTAAIEFVRSQWFHGAHFRVAGNSGGAAAIAYGLTTWSLHRICDGVLLCSGPPMVDLRVSCLPTPDPAFVAFVDAHWPAGMAVPPLYTAPAGSLACQMQRPGGADPQESILHTQPPVLLQYQRRSSPSEWQDVPVDFLFGANDGGVAQALALYDAITSAKTLTVVQGGEHWLATTQSGFDAIVGWF